MVQYYRDLLAQRSEMLAPLISLTGKCSYSKVTRVKKTKKRAWHLDEVHQIALDNVIATIAKGLALAYPNNAKDFEVCTDALFKQFGAVMTDNILQQGADRNTTLLHCDQN